MPCLDQFILGIQPSHPKYYPGMDDSVLNHEPLAINQNSAQGVTAGNLMAGGPEDLTPPQAQVAIQGPNQVALDHVQPMPPVGAAVIVGAPGAALPGPPQPLVLAPEPAPPLMIIMPAANGNPAHRPLMRTLYGFPNILMEEDQDEEGEQVQGADEGEE
ncbi:hypothetical protein FRC09_009278 [Ceratobasidium sp. 395]|nr:hypothetical protein FRC09_009278 [Ceratobasidium sp. 395]